MGFLNKKKQKIMPLEITNGIGKVGVRNSVNILPMDSGAQTFITAAGLTDTTQKNAINALVTNLKHAGIWSKLIAIYPMVGGTATTHKFNLKGPRDLNAAFRLQFNGGWTHTSTGALPNGTTAYAQTYFVPNNWVGVSDCHISFYSRTLNSSSGTVIGVARTINGNATQIRVSQNSFSGTIAGTGGSSYSNNGSTGFFLVNRTVNNVITLLKNDGRSNVSNVIGQTPNQSMLIGAFQSNGAINDFSDRECSFTSIGYGLTTIQMVLFNQIVDNYQNDLGRSVTSIKSFYYSRTYNYETTGFLYNSQITNTQQQSAVDTLVTSLKTAGVWTKIFSLYPMIGGTAETHRLNLVTPGSYNLTFNGGWTHSQSGSTPNGTTAYADSGAIVVVNNAHVSYYSLSSQSGGGDFGACQGNHVMHAHLRSGSATYYRVTTYLAESNFSNSDGRGYYIANRISSSQQVMYRNNVKYTGNVNSSSAPSDGMKFGAFVTNNGVWSYGNKTMALGSVGYGLSDAEATTFYNAVQAFQTTLGRQV